MKENQPGGAFRENASRITALNQRIHETFAHRHENQAALDAWKHACAEFHRQYDALAFPGGYEAGLQKIRIGDARAIEDALVFLELRPYFFRSQYMRTKLIRLLKHAPLSANQSARFQSAQEQDRKPKAGSSR